MPAHSGNQKEEASGGKARKRMQSSKRDQVVSLSPVRLARCLPTMLTNGHKGSIGNSVLVPDASAIRIRRLCGEGKLLPQVCGPQARYAA